MFCKKGVLRNFAKFTGKHLCQRFYFNKVVGLSLQLYWNRDSGKSVFLWILRNFWEHLFLQNTSNSCFCSKLMGTWAHAYKTIKNYGFLRIILTWFFLTKTFKNFIKHNLFIQNLYMFFYIRKTFVRKWASKFPQTVRKSPASIVWAAIFKNADFS